MNVFHPCDPVAYRVEPLVHGQLASVEPVELSKYIELLAESTERLDYQLTTSWNSLSNVSETIAATTAHRSYWKSTELLRLIHGLSGNVTCNRRSGGRSPSRNSTYSVHSEFS